MQTNARTWVRCAVVTALASVMVATPGPGFADSRTHVDPAGDVAALSFTDSGVVVTETPQIKRADVVRVRIAHTAKRVVLRLKVRDLAPQHWQYVAKIQTPGPKYRARVGSHGGIELRVGPGLLGFTCRHKAASSDSDKDTATLRIPRACLGNPTWVRFAVDFYAFSRDSTYADQAFAADGAWGDRGYSLWTYGKRVRP